MSVLHLACTGKEADCNQCHKEDFIIGISVCPSNMEAGVDCFGGMVTPSPTPGNLASSTKMPITSHVQVEPDGRVLITGNSLSIFGTICGDGWSDESASVVCRNAGLSNTGTAIMLPPSSVYRTMSVLHLACTGKEADCNQCHKEDFIIGISVCPSNMEAGVDCFGGMLTPSPTPGHVQVEPDGRVLITGNSLSIFGTICGDGWSDESASVVCRNAGLSNTGTAIMLPPSSVYRTMSVLHLACTGKEADCNQCHKEDFIIGISVCPSNMEAGVDCFGGMVTPSPTPGNLASSTKMPITSHVQVEPDGRVLITGNSLSIFGTICGDGWSDESASVVCRNAGLSNTGTAIMLPPSSVYRTMSVLHLACTGKEADCNQCHKEDFIIGISVCPSNMEAGVDCFGGMVTPSPTPGNLASSTKMPITSHVQVEPDGRVLITGNSLSIFGTICGDGWSDESASVVCRNAGLSNTGTAIMLPPSSVYRTMSVLHLACTGKEADCNQCHKEDFIIGISVCPSNMEAGVDCFGGMVTPSPTPGNLASSTKMPITSHVQVEPDGRVLITGNSLSIFGTICGDGWSDESASVVCRNAGLSNTGTAIMLPPSSVYRTMSVLHLACTGKEADCNQCHKEDFIIGISVCPSNMEAGVDCFGGMVTPSPTPGNLASSTKMPITSHVQVEPDGRVLITGNSLSIFGTICGDGWSDESASVVCRNAGLSNTGTAIMLPPSSVYRTMSVLHLACTGKEADCNQCHKEDFIIGISVCPSNMEAGVDCFGGMLTPSPTPGNLASSTKMPITSHVQVEPDGRVLITGNSLSIFGTICGDGWSDESASVVCRNAGLSNTGTAIMLPPSSVYRTMSVLHLACTGKEADCNQCHKEDFIIGISICPSNMEAGVDCFGGMLTPSPTPGNLASSTKMPITSHVQVEPDGRVLITGNSLSIFGTICGDGWSDESASVVCRNAGLSNTGTAIMLPPSSVYRTMSVLHLACTGKEADCNQCHKEDFIIGISVCPSNMEAGVDCFGGMLTPSPTPGNLASSTKMPITSHVQVEPDGRVLITGNSLSIFGTICGDGWSDESASVVCRNAGLSNTGTAIMLPPSSVYRTMSVLHLACTGKEADCNQCHKEDFIIGISVCPSNMEAGVDCFGGMVTPSPTPGNLASSTKMPITNNRTEEVYIGPNGRVMVFDKVKGIEGTVCSNAWDDRDAEVVCRYLGLGSPAVAETLPRDFGFNRTAFGIHCLGNETDISQCSADTYDVTMGACDQMGDAVARCAMMPVTNNITHDVYIDPSGRVMMFDKAKRTEGTVCSNAWDDRDAEVLCRYLGLGGPASAETLPRDFRFNRTAFGIHCLGNETDLWQCKGDNYDVTMGACNYMDDAVARCGITPKTNNRTEEVYIGPNGRVMVFDKVKGIEGTVCSNAWDDRDAEVVCRYLGLGSPAVAETLPRDFGFNRTAFGIHCLGNETDISQCSADTYDVTMGACDQMGDAVARCAMMPVTNNITHDVYIDPSGRVMMFDKAKRTEGTVCSNAWDDRDAEVLCRYLGLGGPASAETLPRDFRFNRTAFGIHCLGNETDLWQCKGDNYDVTMGACNYMDDAVARCGITPKTNNRTEEVYIGPNGRVMVFDKVKGIEGTVCSNAWDDRDAEVVCRYLGLGSPAVAETLPRDFGFNRTAFGIHCLGNETDISQCSADTYDVTMGACDQMGDAVARCAMMPVTNNITHDVYIDPSGRVMMFDKAKRTEGTVCSNAWDDRDAEVLCRYLGLGGPASAETLPRDFRFNRTAFGIHCLGNETDLWQCKGDNYDVTMGACNYMDDAVARCGITPKTNNRTEEVYIGPNGRVMVFDKVKGIEGTVCSNAWDDRDAEVVCRYLGLGSPAVAETLPRDFGFNRTAFGIHCLGNETDISQCSADTYDVTMGACDQMGDAVARCAMMPVTNNITHDVYIDPSGRVMMFDKAKRTEGTVCSNAWDDRDAEVLCRYLGLGGPASAETLPRDFRFNRTAFGIHCLGNETDLWQCKGDNYDVTMGACNYMDDAVARCGITPKTSMIH
ncbi:deleted in malignant brain tumors 1 protein-like [Ylistrum balloti]|uniref:deleted in malignant brain tumors 1 protein-like n=2 Tax=Ylistrum balloti TaxID=509963 RepID=UPI002905CBF7|nr:deleted in malignant brain tumors 1 protein-like [Ylistrum balloti]